MPAGNVWQGFADLTEANTTLKARQQADEQKAKNTAVAGVAASPTTMEEIDAVVKPLVDSAIGAGEKAGSFLLDAGETALGAVAVVLTLSQKTANWAFKNAWCGSGRPWWRFQSISCSAPAGSTTIMADFLSDPSTSAVTETPSYPLTMFLRPSGTYGIQLANNGKNLPNESRFFHEALHGATGQGDPTLETAFGYGGLEPSSVISSYIQGHVLGICPVNNSH